MVFKFFSFFRVLMVIVCINLFFELRVFLSKEKVFGFFIFFIAVIILSFINYFEVFWYICIRLLKVWVIFNVLIVFVVVVCIFVFLFLKRCLYNIFWDIVKFCFFKFDIWLMVVYLIWVFLFLIGIWINLKAIVGFIWCNLLIFCKRLFSFLDISSCLIEFGLIFILYLFFVFSLYILVFKLNLNLGIVFWG